jgi:hypothetical protein
MKTEKHKKSTMQESLRRFGHMLAIREERGDESENYQIKKKLHDKMLDTFYHKRLK